MMDIVSVIQIVVQVAGFSALAGIMWSKLNRTSATTEENQVLIRAMSVAMATARAESKEIVVHVGDLEVRVRKLEQEGK